MKTIHTELGIGAPADVTWGVLNDLEGWQRWNPVMRGEGAFELGARPKITMSNPGAKPLEITPEIILYEAGKEIRWRRRLFVPGLFDAELGMRVTPEDVGRCRYEQFGVFSGLLAGAFMSRNAKAFDTAFQAMSRSLKRESERAARIQS